MRSDAYFDVCGCGTTSSNSPSNSSSSSSSHLHAKAYRDAFSARRWPLERRTRRVCGAATAELPLTPAADRRSFVGCSAQAACVVHRRVSKASVGRRREHTPRHRRPSDTAAEGATFTPQPHRFCSPANATAVDVEPSGGTTLCARSAGPTPHHLTRSASRRRERRRHHADQIAAVLQPAVLAGVWHARLWADGHHVRPRLCHHQPGRAGHLLGAVRHLIQCAAAPKTNRHAPGGRSRTLIACRGFL